MYIQDFERNFLSAYGQEVCLGRRFEVSVFYLQYNSNFYSFFANIEREVESVYLLPCFKDNIYGRAMIRRKFSPIITQSSMFDMFFKTNLCLIKDFVHLCQPDLYRNLIVKNIDLFQEFVFNVKNHCKETNKSFDHKSFDQKMVTYKVSAKDFFQITFF